ncbi:Response regulator [Sulfidibacter corallicola]|uniref:Response regulator n=1 Tax=Sulfidibacter corallicola TaxID=2818388 RepID=A0A8A4TC24_SULCO|nr:adenylate/guanylate cyclase domain-containing protein [Sulfidibacter corallicola]QTD47659.1 response regulator [Sulfidibacter corallicola]
MPSKILFVDDEVQTEAMIRQMFRREVRHHKYHFLFALNGLEALDVLDAHPDLDVLVTDINMPKMDGLTLIQKARELRPLMKCVIVSAYGDIRNIRTAMNLGAFDFLTKPIQIKDLQITLQKTLDHVHQLKKTAQAVRENNILKMYVNENVLSLMTKPEFQNQLMVNESIEATVIFIDICGFTAMSERQPPDEVVHLLNRLFDQIVKEIIRHDGYVDKFIGDAVMAVFRSGDHLRRAIRCALTVKHNLRTEEFKLAPNLFPHVSIGINSGNMISGNIGSESLQRLDFTVIGDVVNTASRYEAEALPDQIVIGQDLRDQVKDEFECERIGEVNLKNKERGRVLYNVLAAKSDETSLSLPSDRAIQR